MNFVKVKGFLPKTDPAAGPLMPAMRTWMTTIPAASAPSHALTSERPNMRLPDLWSSLSSSEALEAELPDRFWAQRPRPPADDDWCGIAGLVIRDSSICSVEAARRKKRAKSNTLLPTLPRRTVGTEGTRGGGRLFSSQILAGIEAKYTPSKCHELLIISPQIFRPSYSPLTLLLCFSVATVLLWSIQWFSSRMLLCKYTGSHMRLPFICCMKRTYKGEHHRQRVGLNPCGFHVFRDMAISYGKNRQWQWYMLSSVFCRHSCCPRDIAHSIYTGVQNLRFNNIEWHFGFLMNFWARLCQL